MREQASATIVYPLPNPKSSNALFRGLADQRLDDPSLGPVGRIDHHGLEPLSVSTQVEHG
jgi:hypothetical protein